MENLNTSSRYSAIEASIHTVRYAFAEKQGLVGRVLDVASGFGYGSERIASLDLVTEVVGVERSPAAIESARKHKRSKKLRFEQIDLTNLGALSELGEFDSIVCIETIEHLPDPESFLKALKSVWSKKGPLIISMPNDGFYFGRGKSINPFHLNSGSWIETRSMMESELGDASWFFGTVASGFSVMKLNQVGKKTTFEEVFQKQGAPLEGEVLPPTDGHQLIPTNSLFYFGVWAGRKVEADKQVAILFPAASNYRLPELETAPRSVQLGFRPKLVLVVDTRNWAFDNIANQIKRHLSDRFLIEIVYQEDFREKWHDALHHIFIEHRPDFVHYFWRETIGTFLTSPRSITKLVLDFQVSQDELVRSLSQTTITSSVYDHLHLADSEIDIRTPKLLCLDGVGIASRRLQDIYSESYPGLKTHLLEDGVDLDLFVPKNLERFKQHDRKLVVGWVGNSAWNEKSESDPKGLFTILRPALEILAEEGAQVQAQFADRTKGAIPREEMPDYYAKIDVLVCSSSMEGTPNPVLEAMACGVPVLSTDVGLVRDVLGEKQSDFIVSVRTPESFASKLKLLCEDRLLLEALSRENIALRGGHAWAKRMPDWLRFFRHAESVNQLTRTKREVLIRVAISEGLRSKNLQSLISSQSAENSEASHSAVMLKNMHPIRAMLIRIIPHGIRRQISKLLPNRLRLK